MLSGVRDNVTKGHMCEGGGVKSAQKVSHIFWMSPKVHDCPSLNE